MNRTTLLRTAMMAVVLSGTASAACPTGYTVCKPDGVHDVCSTDTHSVSCNLTAYYGGLGSTESWFISPTSTSFRGWGLLADGSKFCCEFSGLDDGCGVGNAPLPVDVTGGDTTDIIHLNYGATDLDCSSDYIYGADLDDTIYGSRLTTTSDHLYGEDDDDTIYGLDGNDYIEGGFDIDTIDGGDGADTCYGDQPTPNADDKLDYVTGGPGDDTLYGNAGGDFLWGGDGADTIYGGDGDDSVKGDADGDVIYGEAGADSLCGNPGNDTIDGGSGNDDIYGGTGSDTVIGGTNTNHCGPSTASFPYSDCVSYNLNVCPW